jgi:hypothetical protein
MSHGRHSTRLLAAAIATLLVGGLSGAPGLVLCLGADGHRAIEFEHGRTECRTLAGPRGATSTSLQAPAECFDLPAAGAGPATATSFDNLREFVAPLSFLAIRTERVPSIETRLRTSVDARAGPVSLAPHLISTVLLV